MSFEIEDSKLDIGETPLENIFINSFMPLASATELKVYIFATYLARSSNIMGKNSYIAKACEIKKEEVREAWFFWKSLGLVDFSEEEAKKNLDFDVKIKSVRTMYINNNFKRQNKQNSSNELRILQDENVKNLFDKLKKIRNSEIMPEQRVKYIELLKTLKLPIEFLEKAFQIVYIDMEAEGTKARNTINKILNNWSAAKLKTIEDLETYITERNISNQMISMIKEKAGLASSKVTDNQKLMYREWKSLKIDDDLILKIAGFCSTHYKNPSFRVINNSIQKIHSEDKVSSESIELYFSKFGKTSQKVKRVNLDKTAISNPKKTEIDDLMKRRNPLLNS